MDGRRECFHRSGDQHADDISRWMNLCCLIRTATRAIAGVPNVARPRHRRPVGRDLVFSSCAFDRRPTRRLAVPERLNDETADRNFFVAACRARLAWRRRRRTYEEPGRLRPPGLSAALKLRLPLAGRETPSGGRLGAMYEHGRRSQDIRRPSPGTQSAEQDIPTRSRSRVLYDTGKGVAGLCPGRRLVPQSADQATWGAVQPRSMYENGGGCRRIMRKRRLVSQGRRRGFDWRAQSRLFYEHGFGVAQVIAGGVVYRKAPTRGPRAQANLGVLYANARA